MRRLLRFIPLLCIVFAVSANATSIQGTVSDSSSGIPVTGARLLAFTFTENGDSLIFEQNTDPAGNFFFGDLPNGVYTLQCTHPAYVSVFRHNIQVTAADVALYFHFRLRKPTTTHHTYIAGHVYSAPEMLPVLIPLENATVVLEGEIIRFSATTGNDGRYSFENIPGGWYFLSAFAPGHIPRTYIDTLFIEENTHIDDLDIYLRPYDSGPVSLSGIVFRSNSDQTIHPAYLSLHPVHTGVIDSLFYEIRNNEDGSYNFTALQPGIYRLECRAAGYQSFVEPALDLTRGDISFNIYLEPLDPSIGNYIGGVVVNSETNLPVYHAQVDLVSVIPPGMGMPSFLYTTYTDDQGRFSFKSIRPWKYTITAWSPGFNISEAETLLITETTQIRDLRLSIKPLNVTGPVTLKGYVFSDSTDSEPVYPAEVILFRNNASGEAILYSTTTNPDGSYAIENIRPANYSVWCQASGYQREVIHNLNLYSDTRLDFYLERLFTQYQGLISGFVYFDETNLPVRGAVLTFFNQNADTPNNFHARTDEYGSYSAVLPVGTYYVSCSYAAANAIVPDQYFYQEFYDDVHSITDATPVRVRPGQVTPDINFGIPQRPVAIEVQISGRVTDEDGTPLEGALVQVWILNTYLRTDVAYTSHTAWTGEDGLYDISLQLPGWCAHYGLVVSARKRGFETEFYKEKSLPYLADVLWVWQDSVFTDINFTLSPLMNAFSITGQVTSETGEAIADGFVIGYRKSNGSVVFTTTDNLGMYMLEPLQEDNYYILFLAHGYVPEFFDDALLWEDATPVYVNGHIHGIDAELKVLPADSAFRLITGRIYDASQDPLPGVVVNAYNSSGAIISSAFSDQSGYYELSNLDQGVHVLQATKVNYPSFSTSMRMESLDGNMTVLNITMDQNLLQIPDKASPVPLAFSMPQNYPNPFNPLTTIRFDLPSAQQIRLVIYNILGQPVRTLAEGLTEAGDHIITWNAKDASGREVASGIYFIVLETAKQQMVRKMIFSK